MQGFTLFDLMLIRASFIAKASGLMGVNDDGFCDDLINCYLSIVDKSDELIDKEVRA